MSQVKEKEKEGWYPGKFIKRASIAKSSKDEKLMMDSSHSKSNDSNANSLPIDTQNISQPVIRTTSDSSDGNKSSHTENSESPRPPRRTSTGDASRNENEKVDDKWYPGWLMYYFILFC